jgi:hypothetical protein
MTTRTNSKHDVHEFCSMVTKRAHKHHTWHNAQQSLTTIRDTTAFACTYSTCFHVLNTHHMSSTNSCVFNKASLRAHARQPRIPNHHNNERCMARYVEVSTFQDLCASMSRSRGSRTSVYVFPGSSTSADVKVSTEVPGCCVCQGLEVPGPLRMSSRGFEVPGSLRVLGFRGSRTSAYVEVSRFQDLYVCQGVVVPGHLQYVKVLRFQDLCLSQGFEVTKPLCSMSRSRGSRTCAYVKVVRFQDLYVKVSRPQDLCASISKSRGSRTAAYVKVSRFQDLCVCQCLEVPGPLEYVKVSRLQASAYVNVSRFQDL